MSIYQWEIDSFQEPQISNTKAYQFLQDPRLALAVQDVFFFYHLLSFKVTMIFHLFEVFVYLMREYDLEELKPPARYIYSLI